LFTDGASLFIVATASTKTMVPLRILAIYFLQLATARLFDNIDRLQGELSRRHAAPA